MLLCCERMIKYLENQLYPNYNISECIIDQTYIIKSLNFDINMNFNICTYIIVFLGETKKSESIQLLQK